MFLESFVKNGVITWENQQTDYQVVVRICLNLNQRLSSWCIIFLVWYSPLRVKYPYIRGKLLDLWTTALEETTVIALQHGPQ